MYLSRTEFKERHSIPSLREFLEAGMSMVADFPKALVESCMEKRTEITPLGNQGERDRKAPTI